MKVVSFVFLLLFTAISGAQNPKIGLVLSGGGAKGFAHIGVIRQLEALGVYPDLITGTSMGSIVGALYAMGYTPDEMEGIVKSQEWNRVLSNSLHYNKVVMSEKDYDSRYFLEVGLNKGKLKFPQGLIHGKELALLLDRITIPAHGIKDFTKFPIPFACVATDITTGEAVLMKSGNINEAIRASMAIPSVFTPVHYDGHLCVDGGIVRNFPVQEALDMGADVVIGSYVSGGFLQEEELNSILDVLFQATTVMGNFDSQEQMKLVDILIEPNISKVSGGDFEKGEQIIAKGDSVVILQRDDILNQLDKLGIDLNQVHRPERSIKDSTFLIEKIEMMGNSTIASKSINKHLHFSTKKRYSASQISDHVTKLYGTKYFSKLNYNLERYSDTSYVLKVTVKEEYPTQIKVAAHYDTENGIGFNTNITFRNVIFPFTRSITEIDLANNIRIKSRYQFFLGRRQRNSINISAMWYEYDLPIYNFDEKQSLLETNRFESKLSVQRTVSVNTVTGLSAGYSFFDFSPEIGPDIIDGLSNVKVNYPFFQFFYRHNNTNHRYFPTKGGSFNLNFTFSRWLSTKSSRYDSTNNNVSKSTEDELFYQTRARLNRCLPISRKLTLTGGFHFLYNLEPSSQLIESAYVGGVNPYFYNTIPFPGAKSYQYTPSNIYVFHLNLQCELFQDFYIIPAAYYGETELLFKFAPNYESQTSRFGGKSRQFCAELKFGYESAIGPIYFSLAKGFNEMPFLTNFGIGFWYK